MDDVLVSLLRMSRSGGAVSEKMTALGIDHRAERVNVDIVAVDKTAIPELKTVLKKLDATVTTDLDNHVWAYVPVSAIEEVSRQDSVWSMSVARATFTPH